MDVVLLNLFDLKLCYFDLMWYLQIFLFLCQMSSGPHGHVYFLSISDLNIFGWSNVIYTIEK